VSRWLCLALMIVASAVPKAGANCAPSQPGWPQTQMANFINLVSPTPFSWLTSGATQWNTTCDVEQVPYFLVSGSSNSAYQNVSVVFVDGPNPNENESGTGCGWTNITFSNGNISQAQITLYASETDGDPCDNMDGVMAHELGHILGLGDAFLSSCSNAIMYAFYNPNTVSVTGAECAAADSAWFTDWEDGDPCNDPNPPQGCDVGQGSDSPILIDVGRDHIRLTGVDRPVAFDFDRDGVVELVSWTEPDSLDLFLWLDRNDNGEVDDGGELFGNHTPLFGGSPADHGFQALAEFDAPEHGGNGDGYIDAGDQIYPSLRLWWDASHDGRSAADELWTLDQVGVIRIELRYRTVGKRDKHGNLLRHKARAWLDTGDSVKRIDAVDVFFIYR